MRSGGMNLYVTLDNKDEQNPVTGMFLPCSPATVWAQIEPLPPSDDGRTLHHAVTMRFHSQVSVDTRITYIDAQTVTHYLFVKGIQDIAMQNVELRCICDEVMA